MTSGRWLGAAVAVLALAVGPASAAERTDTDIEKDVRKAILGYVHYGVFDSVGMAVKDGEVLLEGSVLRGHRKRDIEKRVAAVEGVRSVTSRISVQSASSFDARLRMQVYRAIYGEGLLTSGSTVNPPVRIVVDRGRVTLTGYVLSRLQQTRVGMAARETLAFSVDNRVKLDHEQNREPVRHGHGLVI